MATATLEKPVVAENASQNGRVLARGVSFDEFVSSPQFQGRRVEWVAGEVIEKTSVSFSHAKLTTFLLVVLAVVAEL